MSRGHVWDENLIEISLVGKGVWENSDWGCSRQLVHPDVQDPAVEATSYRMEF